MKKEIVDNETENYKLFQFLNASLENSNKQIAIATGFFNLSGYNLLQKNLWNSLENNNSLLRLLFGRETISIEEPNFDSYFENNNENKNSMEVHDSIIKGYEKSLSDELNKLDVDENSASSVDTLIDFLRKDTVYVRNNKNRFNHAKCYIFDDSVVVGSSNLTGAGLAGNVELNAILYQPSQMDLVRKWFDRRWDESEDVKNELIKLLEDSKFGLPLDPFQMYMKILYEYYKPRLQDLERSKATIIELTEFQVDAVTAALRILKKYNGVIISDSTGLGKTHIGLDLLREFVSVRRKKALLIAPAQVLESVWEPRLLTESIKTKNISLESTGIPSFEPTDYLDFDLVLIDESQNYRSPSTKRRDNIMKVLAGGKRKQVILLTATPVNNSLLDLYYQLSLITSGDDTHFAELGIADLKRYFVSADRKEFASGIDDIIRLLDEVMIRRTRLFIKENYPEATLNGKKLSFPKRILHKVEYSLTALFGNEVYKQVIDTIDRLNLVPYRVDYYIITSNKTDQLEAEQRATLQKFGLLKRFESSVEAIKKSIGRLEKFYDYFDQSLSKGKILDSKTFNKILVDMRQNEEEDDDAFLERLEKEVDLIPLTKEYDLKKMKADLNSDKKLLKPLKESLNKIQPFADRKLTALKEQFIKDQVFEKGGKKVIIFSQFVDTVKYIFRDLEKDFKDKEVDILTGQTDSKTRDSILKRFAPKANFGENIEKEIDILVSSDVLSEGQNLQDANYVVNYDLPWNPMKIVQRVGRVDRLTSEFDEIVSSVFIPEKELEDILGLLAKLETKIQKAAETVGIEATILGEQENPKNFNATSRIMKSDSSLIDEMERSAELLPTQTPFQIIMTYMKKMGLQNLESIPLGKRSGKKSDQAGLVVVYREKKRAEETHMLVYDYKKSRFDHVNDISWIFRKIACDEKEPLSIPLSGPDVFQQIRMVDENARNEILTAINAPADARQAQRIGGKNQREIRELIKNAYSDGQVSSDEASNVYSVLSKSSLVAWEDDFAEFLDDFKRNQNIKSIITALGKLFNRYKIGTRGQEKIRVLNPEDLQLVACEFLTNPSMKDWKIAI
ncbi:MAG: hypothetical protein IIA82_09820 [Thaumarchaeota archaeon]|nr:hypothetical protein [Nitrososphaerota archaeon]